MTIGLKWLINAIFIPQGHPKYTMCENVGKSGEG